MDIVRLTVVRDAHEAEILCALLRTAGIECSQRSARSVEEFSGWTDVLVSEDDLAAARELIPPPSPG